jgi:solute carrier family 25 phosphate transporter 23/24/25/41
MVQKLFSGGAAGAVSRTVTAPIDRIKVTLQAATGRSPGIMSTVRQVATAEGPRAFFRGNGVNVLKVAPETATKFIAFDVLKKMIARDPDNASASDRFIAGGAAGAIAQTLVYPLETVKTRMTVSVPGTYSSIRHCLVATASSEGIPALYRGLVPSAMGIVPYAGIDLAVNSLLKDYVASECEKRGEEPGIFTLLGCGMLSSTTAMFLTYPLNFVRTRLQASGLPGRPVYTGLGDVVRQTVKADGFAGLYRGTLPNLMKVLPATSVSYAVFELLKGK